MPSVGTFAPGVLDQVQALGGLFNEASLCQLVSERRWWPNLEPSWVGEVVCLPTLLRNSYACTVTPVDGHRYVDQLLAEIPSVLGIKWVMGNVSTCWQIFQILGGKWLEDCYTRSTDRVRLPREGRVSLIIGNCDDRRPLVTSMADDSWGSNVGLWPIGIPN